jgi:hypothetical protein
MWFGQLSERIGLFSILKLADTAEEESGPNLPSLWRRFRDQRGNSGFHPYLLRISRILHDLCA